MCCHRTRAAAKVGDYSYPGDPPVGATIIIYPCCLYHYCTPSFARLLLHTFFCTPSFAHLLLHAFFCISSFVHLLLYIFFCTHYVKHLFLYTFYGALFNAFPIDPLFSPHSSLSRCYHYYIPLLSLSLLYAFYGIPSNAFLIVLSFLPTLPTCRCYHYYIPLLSLSLLYAFYGIPSNAFLIVLSFLPTLPPLLTLPLLTFLSTLPLLPTLPVAHPSIRLSVELSVVSYCRHQTATEISIVAMESNDDESESAGQ